MLDGVLGAEAIDRVAAAESALAGGAEAVAKLVAVVGQKFGDIERGGGEQALEETAGAGGGLIRQAFEVDPTSDAVDADKQTRAQALVGHLRQVFDMHGHEARGVVLEAVIPLSSAHVASFLTKTLQACPNYLMRSSCLRIQSSRCSPKRFRCRTARIPVPRCYECAKFLAAQDASAMR